MAALAIDWLIRSDMRCAKNQHHFAAVDGVVCIGLKQIYPKTYAPCASSCRLALIGMSEEDIVRLEKSAMALVFWVKGLLAFQPYNIYNFIYSIYM